MLKSNLVGLLNSQLNKGTAIRDKILKISSEQELQSLSEEYEVWNTGNLFILRNGFVSEFRKPYSGYSNIKHLPNVYNGDNHFEKKRAMLLDLVPRQLISLQETVKDIKNVSLDKLLPVNLNALSTQVNQGPTISLQPLKDSSNNMPTIEDYSQVDYAIITALEEDEMEMIHPMIETNGRVEDSNHFIEYGVLKANSNKRIAFASQHATGMVDAGILSTELILRFKPKYLIMAGVLAGKPKDVEIGDIVVATRVFTIDKGKLSKLGFRKELEGSEIIDPVFTALKRNKKNISRFIEDADATRKNTIGIHFGPIACVRQVIDLEGFFQERIETEDRKAVALEMESYGVSRACELVNRGNTTALIVKSVMDNSVNKTDSAKSLAAYNSAKFVEYILRENLI